MANSREFVNSFNSAKENGFEKKMQLPNFLEQMRPWNFVQFGFVDDFNRHLFAREHMPRQFHGGKMPNAKCLLQII